MFLSVAFSTLFSWLLVLLTGFPYREGKAHSWRMFSCKNQTNRRAHTDTHSSFLNYHCHKLKITHYLLILKKLLFSEEMDERRIQRPRLHLANHLVLRPVLTESSRWAGQCIFQQEFLTSLCAAKNRILRWKCHSGESFGTWTSADMSTFSCLLLSFYKFFKSSMCRSFVA